MEGLEIAVIVSRFHEEVTEKLLECTLTSLEKNGIHREEINICRVPGALEIPFVANKLALIHDVVICLGAVIRGETSHYEVVCDNVARQLSDIGLRVDIPVINGVLTVENLQQATERVDRGHYFAEAAIEMALLNQSLDAEIDIETDEVLNFLDTFDNAGDFEQN